MQGDGIMNEGTDSHFFKAFQYFVAVLDPDGICLEDMQPVVFGQREANM